MTKVRQEGLFTTSEEALQNFADRVDKFNRDKGFVVVEMEGRESLPDKECDKPHWKVLLEFKSRQYANAFWTDPEYQTRLIK